MQPVSQTRKKVSIAMKLIVILSAATGIVMSASAGRNTFMGGSRVFMYFTIQSNIAAALMSIAGGYYLLRKKAAGRIWRIVKLAITVSITLTGVVFAVLLVPILGGVAWSVPNTLTHLVVPLAAVADFFLVMPGAEMKKKECDLCDHSAAHVCHICGDRVCEGLGVCARADLSLFLSVLGKFCRSDWFYGRTALYGMCLVDTRSCTVPDHRRLMLYCHC